ncbi:hypothetical protein [Pseudophaeobacter sp. EL27]|uniref:5' nucleotidase, NT5C type n=1 Tax=Pseudophaeobacter sp. EL27 TaxID=2107580 RepID=UPI000EFCDFB0|nr:hypothetical protein [Pseudophaeobacter sp. EL27]
MPFSSSKKTCFVDMDDVMCDFLGAYQKAIEHNPAMTFPQAEHGFFRRLPEVEGAVDAVKTLAQTFDLWILSAPSVFNPMSYTEKRVWVEEHLGFDFCERLILSCNKGFMKGDFLVDDRVRGHGQELFEGEIVQFGSASFPSWDEVLRYLLPRA